MFLGVKEIETLGVVAPFRITSTCSRTPRKDETKLRFAFGQPWAAGWVTRSANRRSAVCKAPRIISVFLRLEFNQNGTAVDVLWPSTWSTWQMHQRWELRIFLRLSDAAFFSFADLCDRPLGAADYLAVGHAFHTAPQPNHEALMFFMMKTQPCYATRGNQLFARLAAQFPRFLSQTSLD